MHETTNNTNRATLASKNSGSRDTCKKSGKVFEQTIQITIYCTGSSGIILGAI